MRAITLALLVALAGCAGQPPPSSANSSPAPAIVRQVVGQGRLKQQIERRVSEVWAAPAAEGEFPASVIAGDKRDFGTPAMLDEIAAAALENVFLVTILEPDILPVRRSRHLQRLPIMPPSRNMCRKSLKSCGSARSGTTHTHQTRLAQGEPAVMNDFHDCLFEGVDWMALVFDEPAASHRVEHLHGMPPATDSHPGASQAVRRYGVQ